MVVTQDRVSNFVQSLAYVLGSFAHSVFACWSPVFVKTLAGAIDIFSLVGAFMDAATCAIIILFTIANTPHAGSVTTAHKFLAGTAWAHFFVT